MKLSKNLPTEVEQIEEAVVDSPLSSESVKNPKEIQKEKRTKDIQLQLTWDNDPNPRWYATNFNFNVSYNTQ